MWCKNCNLETNEAICPVCGLETSEDLPVEIYWCNDCRIPVIHVSTAADKGICPVCHGKTRYLTADLRPVFPEERLLIALLLDKDPDALMQKSVWATGSRYYIDGKSLSISTKTFETADCFRIRKRRKERHNHSRRKWYWQDDLCSGFLRVLVRRNGILRQNDPEPTRGKQTAFWPKCKKLRANRSLRYVRNL